MKKICTIAAFIFFTVFVRAQEVQFSQFYQSPLHLSPSYAGSTNGSRVVMNYRNQWPEISNSFVTLNFSYDQYLPKIKSGIGVSLITDKKGELDYNMTSLGLIYTYDVVISHQYHFRPSFNFSYTYNGINHSAILLPDQMVTNSPTPLSVPEIERVNMFDLTSSVLFYGDKFWIGITINHLLRPNQSFYSNDRLPLTYNFFGGANIHFRSRLIKPREEHFTVAYNYRQSAYFSQFDIGTIAFFNPVFFGIWYRGIPVLKKNPTYDAIIFNFGYIYKRFTLGYSYDFTISGLRSNTGGAHELSIIYLFELSDKLKTRPTAVPCPTVYNPY